MMNEPLKKSGTERLSPPNQNESTTVFNLWDAIKTVIRETFKAQSNTLRNHEVSNKLVNDLP